MVERDLGQATLVYEDPDEGIVEKTVQNEHVAYFQDHWIVRTGEDQQGEDIVRRIPLQRVYYVERSVEEFEDEVKTLRDQVQGIAGDLRSKILGGNDPRDESARSGDDTKSIAVEDGESDESRN